MKLSIEIHLDNAAFDDEAGGSVEEVARILADLAERLPDPLAPTRAAINLRDSNGNHVGDAEIEGD